MLRVGEYEYFDIGSVVKNEIRKRLGKQRLGFVDFKCYFLLLGGYFQCLLLMMLDMWWLFMKGFDMFIVIFVVFCFVIDCVFNDFGCIVFVVIVGGVFGQFMCVIVIYFDVCVGLFLVDGCVGVCQCIECVYNDKFMCIVQQVVISDVVSCIVYQVC